MGRNSFYILSFGFTFSTLNFKFPSTLVENSLQITPFYAKQTQFPKKSNDVYPYNTTDYERKRNWTLGENKPNTNPNKPNLQKAKMNITSFITRDYSKKDNFLVRINKPNSNPISEKLKMNVNLYVIEDYREKDDFAVQKNKPKQTKFQTGTATSFYSVVRRRLPQRSIGYCRTDTFSGKSCSADSLTDWPAILRRGPSHILLRGRT